MQVAITSRTHFTFLLHYVITIHCYRWKDIHHSLGPFYVWGHSGLSRVVVVVVVVDIDAQAACDSCGVRQ